MGRSEANNAGNKKPAILADSIEATIAAIYFDGGLDAAEKFIIDNLKEAGACGTAAVITPIGGIQHKGVMHVFHSETEVGPVTKKLYDTLYGIQMGDVKAPEGWIFKVL